MQAHLTSWEDRFWAKVEEDPATGCWNWTGACNPSGYGNCRVPGKGARNAHRVAYELVVGKIRLGLEIDHRCRNTSCVNPAHLEAVTHRENMLRGRSFAAAHSRRTHCPQGHAYSGANLLRFPSDRRRYCRACRAARDAGRER